jgi:hypothetical protein
LRKSELDEEKMFYFQSIRKGRLAVQLAGKGEEAGHLLPNPGADSVRRGYSRLQALYAGWATCHKDGAFLATRGMNRASSGAIGHVT